MPGSRILSYSKATRSSLLHNQILDQLNQCKRELAATRQQNERLASMVNALCQHVLPAAKRQRLHVQTHSNEHSRSSQCEK